MSLRETARDLLTVAALCRAAGRPALADRLVAMAAELLEDATATEPAQPAMWAKVGGV
jgi:hypothetical protein